MSGDYRRPVAPYDPSMGFNPFRKQRTTSADVVMVAGALLAAVALVIWAITG